MRLVVFPMKIGKKLASLRIKKSLTQDDMANILGIKRARYNSWENDIAKPDIEMITKIANYHKISLDSFLELNPSPVVKTTNIIAESTAEYKINNNTNSVPLLGSICAGDGLYADQNIEEYVLFPYPNRTQPDFALRVKGDSMSGVGIEDGDIVFLRKAKWAEFNGQIVAAIVNGEDGTLKKMRWDSNNPFVSLESANESYSKLELLPNEINICGVYAGHFKPEKEM